MQHLPRILFEFNTFLNVHRPIQDSFRVYLVISYVKFPPILKMSLFELLLSSDSPRTSNSLAEETGRGLEDIEQELERLLSENAIRKRVFPLGDGKSKAVYWSSSQITFTEQQPIITSPFSEPFSHQEALERLSDSQLQQEKSWLQTKLGKVDSDLKHMQYLAKVKIDEEKEAQLDELADKWMNAIHDMLWDLLSKAKKANSEMTMDRVLRELRIDPETVGWNKEEEDFV